MKGRIGVFILGLIVAMPCAVQADPNVDSLRAMVTEFGVRDISVSARSSSIGTDVRGSMKFTATNFDPNQTAEGEITCLRIVSTPTGAVASYGGEITRVTPGFTQLFGPVTAFQGFASDSGKFSTAPDTFLFQFLFGPPPPTTCPTPAPGNPVNDGEVIIHDAL